MRVSNTEVLSSTHSSSQSHPCHIYQWKRRPPDGSLRNICAREIELLCRFFRGAQKHSISDRRRCILYNSSRQGGPKVIKYTAITFAVLACLASAPTVFARDSTAAQAPPAGASSAQVTEQNVNEYIDLLRKDVRSQKSAIMDTVMQLDLDQAAKFWPIYRDYDAELKKLTDLRVSNIKEYAKSYDNLTDAQADQLVQNAISYQKQRMELLLKYYGRVKESLGGVTAARFMQVEHQLLLIIDLQIDSSLPIAGS